MATRPPDPWHAYDEALVDEPTHPTLTLFLEAAMVNPPKPLGFIVHDGERFVGVMSIDELRKGLAQWNEAQAKRKT